jgi:hypothetical protein
MRSSSLPSSPSTTILRLRDRIRQLEADAINLQDDSAQYRSEYLRIQREMKGFFSSYAQKCQKLKMMQERQEILLEEIKKRVWALHVSFLPSSHASHVFHHSLFPS